MDTKMGPGNGPLTAPDLVGVDQRIMGTDGVRDFGLIRLNRKFSRKHAYDPAVCFFGGPTRMPASHEPAEGQRAHLYGQGVAWYVRETGDTTFPGRTVRIIREDREGKLLQVFPPLSTGGDSGAPLIGERGEALGFLNRAGGLAVSLRPALALAEQTLGIELELRTAPVVDEHMAEGSFGADPF